MRVQHEWTASDGRNLEKLTWALCAAMGVVVCGWIALTDFTVDLRSGLLLCALVLGLFVLIRGYSRWRPDERIASTLTGLAQIIVFTVIGTPLSYLMASLSLPYWDATLHEWDRALGLDWRTYLDWVNAHPTIGTALSITYQSILPQMVVALAALGLTGRTREMRLFVSAVTVSGLATIVISGVTPALAMFVHLGLTPEDYPDLRPAAAFVHKAAMDGLRSGSLREILLNEAEGIITFPSYHAALAIVFMRAFWSIPRLRWAGFTVNALMIAATPIDGGHYFVDVFAGAALAILTIAVLRRWIEGSRVRTPQAAIQAIASLQ